MIYQGDILEELKKFEHRTFQAIIADPPYFQVLEHDWDNQWKSEGEYLKWTQHWVHTAGEKLRDDGLFYIFGQLGKREHVWLHVCSLAARTLQFHDMIIWDRGLLPES